MVEKTKSRQDPNEEMEIDGFPDYDDEFNSVQEINSQMRKARQNWEPPEKPSYEDTNDGGKACYTGIVRSIDRTEYSGNDDKIELGVDIGESSLMWVSIKDTGDASIDNPYISFCKTYGISTSSIEDIYGEEIYIGGRKDDPIIKPQIPVIKSLWNLFFFHKKNNLYKYEQKNISEGVVPKFKFIALHGLLATVTFLMSSLVLMPIFLISLALTFWGSYVKTKYDILPYVGNLISYYWQIYSHKKA